MEGLAEVVDTGNQFHFRSEAELIRYLRSRFIESQSSPERKEPNERREHYYPAGGFVI